MQSIMLMFKQKFNADNKGMVAPLTGNMDLNEALTLQNEYDQKEEIDEASGENAEQESALDSETDVGGDAGEEQQQPSSTCCGVLFRVAAS